jgi:hypothetical protein
MPNLLLLAAGALLVVGASACGGRPEAATPTPEPSAPTAEPASLPGAPPLGTASQPTGASEPASSPPRPPRPAADSSPDGLDPLTDAERTEFEQRCKAFVSAVTQAGKKAGRTKSSTEIALDVLANPPKSPGVDSERCAPLMKRELVAYRARTIEIEAILALKQLAFAMADAHAKNGALCPSAPAIPSALDGLAKEPYASTSKDWSAPGWLCVNFAISPPQRFQFELRSDAGAASYEIVARGFPVEGGPATELFVRGKVEAGQLSPSQEIFRR